MTEVKLTVEPRQVATTPDATHIVWLEIGELGSASISRKPLFTGTEERCHGFIGALALACEVAKVS